jgi:hypothetical protein
MDEQQASATQRDVPNPKPSPATKSMSTQTRLLPCAVVSSPPSLSSQGIEHERSEPAEKSLAEQRGCCIKRRGRDGVL